LAGDAVTIVHPSPGCRSVAARSSSASRHSHSLPSRFGSPADATASAPPGPHRTQDTSRLASGMTAPNARFSPVAGSARSPAATRGRREAQLGPGPSPDCSGLAASLLVRTSRRRSVMGIPASAARSGSGSCAVAAVTTAPAWRSAAVRCSRASRPCPRLRLPLAPHPDGLLLAEHAVLVPRPGSHAHWPTTPPPSTPQFSSAWTAPPPAQRSPAPTRWRVSSRPPPSRTPGSRACTRPCLPTCRATARSRCRRPPRPCKDWTATTSSCGSTGRSRPTGRCRASSTCTAAG